METDIFDGLFSKKDDSISKHLELQTKAKVQSSNKELEVWLSFCKISHTALS